MSGPLNRATIPWIANYEIPSRILRIQKGRLGVLQACRGPSNISSLSLGSNLVFRTNFVCVMTNHNTSLLLFRYCGAKGIITLDPPPLCSKFVPRISVDIWIKGGLGPTITSVFDRVWPPALCPCSLYSIPPYLLCQVSLAPNCAL